MVSCLLLCAGSSSRFGSPKALAKMGQETVIGRLQNVILRSSVKELVIVTGAHEKLIKPYLLNHKKIKCVHNKNYILGQTSSFQAGLDEVCPQASGLMLLPVDFPFVSTETIDLLVEKFEENPEKIVIPVHEGSKGHPPIFPASLKNEFLSLEASEGLNIVQRRYPERIFLCTVSDAGVRASFNTKQELKELSESF
ncbi:MAG: nucleotidyltransferase family protein [Candidatus Omnitrophota bacterium]